MEIGLGYYGTFRFVSCSLHLDSRTWRATTTTIKVSSLGNCRILDGPHGPSPPSRVSSALHGILRGKTKQTSRVHDAGGLDSVVTECL